MCMVAPHDRLASAAVVFFGHRGDITRHANLLGVSRQSLYRQANSTLRDLDTSSRQQTIADLRRQVADLNNRLQQLQAQQDERLLGDDLPAEFACTAQADGVSLPVARRLLEVVLRDKTPSVATLGRHTRRAGLRAGPLLEILDEYTRPQARQVAADEIFFGQKPVLMVVEPESLCWLSGRLSPRRDGEQWAKEFQQLSGLEHLVRDGGTGLANGVARVNEQRQQDEKKPVTEQLDHFHTLREGRRGLRKAQTQAERAWTAAEEADQKVARQNRRGQSRTGYATQAARQWQKAEAAFHEWERVEGVVKQIRQALLPFTAQGELNRREQAMATVATVTAQLPGEHWDKFKRQLRQPETYTYLDRLKEKIEALDVPEEVKEAVVQSEGLRQNPELVRGDGPGSALMRGVLLVLAVVLAKAGKVGQAAVAALQHLLQSVGRASSCVEGLNSVVRMQQSRHRKMTQEMLDLKRVYWNLRQFRTGRRKKTSPYGRLGVPLPADLSWWKLIQMSPDQLRSLLSAQPTQP